MSECIAGRRLQTSRPCCLRSTDCNRAPVMSLSRLTGLSRNGTRCHTPVPATSQPPTRFLSPPRTPSRCQHLPLLPLVPPMLSQRTTGHTRTCHRYLSQAALGRTPAPLARLSADDIPRRPKCDTRPCRAPAGLEAQSLGLSSGRQYTKVFGRWHLRSRQRRREITAGTEPHALVGGDERYRRLYVCDTQHNEEKQSRRL